MIGATLLLAASWVSQVAVAEVDGDLEARWRREYPAAAAELEKNARSFLAHGVLEDQRLAGNTLTANAFTLACSGDKRLMVRDRETLDSPDEEVSRSNPSLVWCRTPEYIFMLKKEPDANSYMLASYARNFDETEDFIFSTTFDELARCATMYQAKTLSERMQSPSFAIKAIDLIQEGGKELARIDYTVDLVLDGIGTMAETGSVRLDPARNWIICGAEGVRQAIEVVEKHKGRADLNPWEFKIEVEYQEVSDHVFFPSRLEVTEDRQPANPDLRQHRVMELSQVTLGDVPDRVFKLSGYGLPDVPLRPSDSSSMFPFRNPLFWGALVAAVVLFALLWATRKRTRAGSA